MIIEKVILYNWQGYHGEHEFDFKGSGGRCNSFIYADNTVGKSAFWEAIQFVLFGRVQRRRTTNQYRPFVAENSGDYPLMNTDEWGKLGARFHVEISFTHDEVRYRLFRGFKPKIENKPVKLPNHMKQELELENLDARGKDRFIEDVNGWIGENVLPARLAKFFLFPRSKLSTTRTIAPFLINLLTRLVPIKPPPPVTKTFLFSQNINSYSPLMNFT